MECRGGTTTGADEGGTERKANHEILRPFIRHRRIKGICKIIPLFQPYITCITSNSLRDNLLK